MSIIDAIFVTKTRQKVVMGITGFLGVSFISMSIIITSVKPEDIQPIAKS